MLEQTKTQVDTQFKECEQKHCLSKATQLSTDQRHCLLDTLPPSISSVSIWLVGVKSDKLEAHFLAVPLLCLFKALHLADHQPLPPLLSESVPLPLKSRARSKIQNYQVCACASSVDVFGQISSRWSGAALLLIEGKMALSRRYQVRFWQLLAKLWPWKCMAYGFWFMKSN